MNTPFTFAGGRWLEPLRETTGAVVGVLVREQRTLKGCLEVAAAVVEPGLFRLTLRVSNHNALEGAAVSDRDEALMSAMVSTHVIMGVRDGAFVSLMDPPECWRQQAAACRNVGTWPVLVGEEGQRDLMLSSPIILYDYPQVAPESPGDLFDGTEIDEILTLRIMALTGAEKAAMAAVDERAAALLSRTESLARAQLLGLHGTVRGLRTLGQEDAHG